MLHLGNDENLFSPAWIQDMNQAQHSVSKRPAPLVTVGGHKFYSNGLDLDWFGANPDQGARFAGHMQLLLARVLTLSAPTLAAISGHAFGAGALLALAHDGRVMRSDRGYLCLPEVDIGVPFTPGMSALIQGKLVPRIALEAMTSGRRYSGEQALDCGIVDATADQANLLDVALSRVRDLGAKNPATLGAIKKTMFSPVVSLLREPVSGPAWSRLAD